MYEGIHLAILSPDPHPLAEHEGTHLTFSSPDLAITVIFTFPYVWRK